MSEFDQMPIPTGFNPEFAENTEERCACVLLLDTSYSMQGPRLNELNRSLKQLKAELMEDSLAAKRVELAVVTFGPVELNTDWTSVDQYYPEELQATGDTPMGEAIERGLDLLDERKQTYKSHGIPYYRPWVILITDGSPTDSTTYAKQMIADGESHKKFSFFPIGVDDADMNALNDLTSKNQAVKLEGHKFSEFFSWLSDSLKAVSASTPGDVIDLPPISGWARID